VVKVDLRTQTVKEMKELRARLNKAILNKEKQAKGKVLKELKAAAKAAGFTLDQLISGGATAPRKSGATAPRKSKGSKLAPKYRHPENSTITWSGVGRRPKWIEAAMSAGTLENLKVMSSGADRRITAPSERVEN